LQNFLIFRRRQFVEFRTSIHTGRVNAVEADYVGYRIMSSTFVPP
jgi:hypothetical protein